MIDAPIGFVPVQGAEIGDDHVWWFHRTFRERAPGGFGKARRAGRRTRGRGLRSDGFGRSNSASAQYAEEQYTPPHLLALALLGLCEARDFNNAAKATVLHLRGMADLPGVFQSWLDEEAVAPARGRGQPSLLDWRGAALREYRRVYAALRAEHGLDKHLAWLRENESVRDFLVAEKARLIREAGQPERP